MPTYEYECLGCRRRFEIEQPITDPALTECPQCLGRLQRVIGAGGGFIIKGTAGRSGGCSLEQTGTACCGRQSRCAKPACD